MGVLVYIFIGPSFNIHLSFCKFVSRIRFLILFPGGCGANISHAASYPYD